MDAILDNPFAPPAAACLVTGLLISLLARTVKLPALAGLAAPLVFLIGYYFTYNKIPAFPPVGSTNKIFYIVIAASLIGFVLDVIAAPLAARGPVRAGLSFAAALSIGFWIAVPRFATADAGFVALLAALTLGGALILWRLASLGNTPDSAGGPVAGWIVLAVLPAALAPIAVFGGSSTSVGLCIGLTTGIGAAALICLFAPRALGFAAVLGAGGGLLAMIDTIVLITRRADLVALAVYLAVLFAGQIGVRLLLPQGRLGPRVRAILSGVMAAAPVAAILAILFLRNQSPL